MYVEVFIFNGRKELEWLKVLKIELTASSKLIKSQARYAQFLIYEVDC